MNRICIISSREPVHVIIFCEIFGLINCQTLKTKNKSFGQHKWLLKNFFIWIEGLEPHELLSFLRPCLETIFIKLKLLKRTKLIYISKRCVITNSGGFFFPLDNLATNGFIFTKFIKAKYKIQKLVTNSFQYDYHPNV